MEEDGGGEWGRVSVVHACRCGAVGWERIHVLCFTVPPTRQTDNMQVHIHMTYPLLVLESAPITTPPLYSTAMMEVLGGGRGKESELLATTMHTTNQVLVLVEGCSSLLQPGISIALHGQTHLVSCGQTPFSCQGKESGTWPYSNLSLGCTVEFVPITVECLVTC